MTLEEMKKEFEEKFDRLIEYDGLPEFIDHYYQPHFVNPELWKWIEIKIKEAKNSGLLKALEILEVNKCDADGYHACSQQEIYKDLIKEKIK